MRKILFLTVGFDGGGSGKMAVSLEKFLSNFYKTITLVFFEDKGIFNVIGKKINVKDLLISSFPGKGYIELIPHVISTIKYIKKEKPDFVIGIGTYGNLLGLIAKKFLKFKLLLTQHEHITSWRKYIPILSLYNLAFPMIKILIGNNKLICVSNEVKLDSIKYYGINENQAQTIYNGLNIDEIKELGNEKINIKDKYIINIGRLDDGKNQELLIKAYSKSKIKDTYKLLLLGKGDKEEYLKNLCKKLNIENFVIFAGFDKNPYKYLKKASLFCFTSKSESFGLVLLESLILGVPIITVPVTGAKEVLNNGMFGIITKDWSEGALTKELDNFISGGKITANENRMEFINKNFSIEAMGKKYLATINNL